MKTLSKIIRITLTDPLSLLFAIFPLILFIMGIVPFIFGDISISRGFWRPKMELNQSIGFSLLLISNYLFIPSFIIYVWRVLFMKNILFEQEITKGEITEINFKKDRGFVRFTYNVNSKQLSGINYIMKNRITSSFKAGDRVYIAFRKLHPEKAFIKSFYE